ncbi:MAG: serine hydrolase domain-containing protein [Sphingomonas sp.]
MLRDAIDQKRVPGVSLALSYRGAPFLRSAGYSDIEHDIRATSDTPFWVMSVTKEFIATSIMLLAERGQLNIDDPLVKYLPDFPRASEVTLRELLSHTAGLNDFLKQPRPRRDLFIERLTADPDNKVTDLVDFIAGMEPNPYEFDPGTAWDYSNSNFVVPSAVIEKVSGMPWQQFLRRNLFEPLRLDHTAVDSLYEIVPMRAAGYRRNNGQFINAATFPRNAAGAAGSMRSTARDLLTWQMALTGGRVVNAASLRQMMEPARVKDGRVTNRALSPSAAQQNPNGVFAYGLGFMIDQEAGRRVVGHIGNFPGYETVVRTYPDNDLTLAVLTNISGGATELAPKIAKAIFDNASPRASRAALACIAPASTPGRR